ncbi:murein transglycosylase A [Chelatococcus reniformis]|uniref:peptidoglycan lytic exotransglycosylase n=1 Tax=Chelatococcus reniformis TaxID=1494448 RepID=A0A916X7G4_9HYPH|nr:MltA domain-containing protein [Chelatococcus reniformis]GGC51677.1 transglycosylase [Chelatococcus reniformis]
MAAQRPDVALEPVAYADLAGWARDDHAAAFAAFLKSCPAIAADAAGVRAARPGPPGLADICRAALVAPGGAEARRFFEAHFRPFVIGAAGFVTAYFEPEIGGSTRPTAIRSVPLLARPADLVAVTEANRPAVFDPALSAARSRPAVAGGGALEPYPDRAAIEDGALGAAAAPLAFLDPVDLFMAHVQGSVRVRFDDGHVRRFAYAGRNGHPYTSAARLLVERLGIAPAAMTADKLYGWLRANREEGRRIMRQNRSYIFFRPADELGPDDGPVGGAGVPLTPLRSLAVDRSIWSYGLPMFVTTVLPLPSGERRAFAQLLIAHDTGSAIQGPARGDIFMGSGAVAGLLAGLVREPARLVVLLPAAAGAN